LKTLTGHTDWIDSIAFSKDGQDIASGAHDNTIVLWNPFSGRLQKTLYGHTNWVMGLAYSSNGELVSASYDSSVKIWNTGNSTVTCNMVGHKGRVNCVCFSDDSSYVLSGGNDKSVIVWSKGNRVSEFFCKAPVTALSSSVGHLFSAGDSLGNVYIFRLVNH